MDAPDEIGAQSLDFGSPLRVIRKALNQLTDHGSQKCLDCLHYRSVGMEATEEIQERMDVYEDALWCIAAGERPDGTFNRDREACARLARQALGSSFFETVTKSADSPITEERPRDVGAPGAAT